MQLQKLSCETLLVVACAMVGAACSAGERLVQADPIPVVAGPTVARGGIEGLKEDIAWARSLPLDVKLGTSAGIISRDELVAGLEAGLRGLTKASSSPRLSMSPSAPRLDLSPGDVGGSSSMYYLYTDSQGYRWVRLYAYTTCNQGSMVIAKIELKADWYNFQTNAYIAPWLMWDTVHSAPNYASNSATGGIGGTMQARGQAKNKHTCEYGDPKDYPHKFTTPSTVV